MKKAIILLSGGLDSTTCLAYALSQQFDCHALSFNYGQKSQAELSASTAIARRYQVPHTIFEIGVGQFGGSALTDKSIAVPAYIVDRQDIPVTYVPARNTIFLSVALGFAEVLHAKNIFIGVSAIDYSNYPDCRPVYIETFQKLANLATREGIEHGGLTIHTPLIHLSKAETIRLGVSLGVDYAMTVTCYQATDEGEACGLCDSCMLRKKGFKEANVADITRYDAVAL